MILGIRFRVGIRKKDWGQKLGFGIGIGVENWRLGIRIGD